jgi:hypothetical protein
MRRVPLALLLAAISAPAQWQVITPAPTTADLRGIDNVGNGIAWASGSNGTVLRTQDAGKSWTRCATPPDADHLDFRAVQAFDASTAIVMSIGKGPLSRLYKTTDGCHTWKLLFTNPDSDGFWDGLMMTSRNIGILIGDPIRSSLAQPSPLVFPTYHTIDGGVRWSRNDGNRLESKATENGEPAEGVFAASNSSLLLVPYLTLLVSGGRGGALHYEHYTIGTPFVASRTETALAKGESAGGFSIAANWALGSYFPQSRELHARTLSSDVHAVVIVGGDYKAPEKRDGAASVCKPSGTDESINFQCNPAQTAPHGFRSAVTYDAASKTWITVGPNGTDISTDDGRNWRPLHPDPQLGDTPDADQHWNALSLPYVVGPGGRIGILRLGAVPNTQKSQ